MKFATFAFAAIGLVASATAQLTYNATLLDETNPDDYKCLTTAKFNKQLPECIRKCQVRANRNDRCAYNDYACHCANYQEYSDLIEPCAFPPEIIPDAEGACNVTELRKAQPVVNKMCNYFNATQYASYGDCGTGECGIETSPLVYLDVVAKECTTVTE